MSDTELSDVGPTDDVLEQELRQVVRGIIKSGDLEGLTVKRVRLAAEKNLRLEEGFYKSDAWKERSKGIIENEAQSQNKAKPQPKDSGLAKRKSPELPGPAKRQKITAGSAKTGKDPKERPKPRKQKSSERDDAPSSALSDAEDQPEEPSESEKPRKAKPKATEFESELSSVIDDSPKPKKRKKQASTNTVSKPRKSSLGGDSSSPLSSPLDSTPPPVKKKSKSRSKSAAESPPSRSKTKTKSKPPPRKGSGAADPEVDEIKSLQSWLAKCGIRKVWGKELKPYETGKEKIAHLKSMLADAGMTGRYSIEKAHRIKEARELQADLEAVQEGAKYWGKSDDEVDRGARRRRLARPFQARRRIVDEDDDENEEEEESRKVAEDASDDEEEKRAPKIQAEEDESE